MADFLGGYSKKILLLFADEFDTSISKVDKVKAVILAIERASNDEVVTEMHTEVMVKGKTHEIETQLELEYNEKERQLELDRKEKEKLSMEMEERKKDS